MEGPGTVAPVHWARPHERVDVALQPLDLVQVLEDLLQGHGAPDLGKVNPFAVHMGVSFIKCVVKTRRALHEGETSHPR